MNGNDLNRLTQVLLSFSSAYTALARRLAEDLRAANIQVRYDQWEGGGGVTAIRSIDEVVTDVTFVLPLLTPSDAAPTWIGDEWIQSVYEKARAHGIDVLPVRGEGDLSAVPQFLRARSFADLTQDYDLELQRLIETIRKQSGDTRINLPVSGIASVKTHLQISQPADPIVIEIGEDLVSLFDVDEEANRFRDEMIPMMRDGLFYELGVRFPRPVIRTGSDVSPSSVCIRLYDIPEVWVELQPDWVMVNDRVSTMVKHGFVAKQAKNPANNATCAWIPAHNAVAARERGLTTWDMYEFLILTISSLLRRKAANFLGIDETKALLKLIEPIFPRLIAETVPKTVSYFLITDVLQRLVAEGVSIRNLRRILMALADWGRSENDPLHLTEYVRAVLQREITHQLSRGTNSLVVFLLHPDIETLIGDSIRHTTTGSYIDLKPDQLRGIMDAIREPLSTLPDDAQVPQILTTMEIRSSVRRLVAPSLPKLAVVSYQELKPTVRIQPVGRISLNGFRASGAATVDEVPIWN